MTSPPAVVSRRPPAAARWVFFVLAFAAFALLFVYDEGTRFEALHVSPVLHERYWFVHRGGAPAIGGLVVQLVVVVTVMVLGGRALRGGRVPGALILGLAMLPFVVALPGALLRERAAIEDLAAASAHFPSGALRWRLGFLGRRMGMSFWLFEEGARATRTALRIAGLAGVMSLFTVDAPRRGRRWLVTALTGLAATIACGMAAAAIRGDALPATFLDVTSILGVLLTVLAATRAARLPVRGDPHAEAVRDLGSRALLVASLSFALAAIFAEAAGGVSAIRGLVDLGCMDNLDFSGWLGALPKLAVATGRRALLAILYGAVPLVVLAPAGATRGLSRRLREPRAWATLAAVVVPLLLGGLAVWRVDLDLAALHRPFELGNQAVADHDVALPHGDGTISNYDAAPLGALVLADGTVVDRHLPRGRFSSGYINVREGAPEVFVGADRRVPFDVALGNLGATFAMEPPFVVGFLATPVVAPLSPPPGGLAGFVGGELAAYQVLVHERLAEPLATSFPVTDPDAWAIVVLPDGDSVRVVLVRRDHALSPVAVRRVQLPPQPIHGFDARMRAEQEVLDPMRAAAGRGFGGYPRPMTIFAPSAGTPLGEVLATVDRFPLRDEYLVLTTDRGALEEALRAAPPP